MTCLVSPGKNSDNTNCKHSKVSVIYYDERLFLTYSKFTVVGVYDWRVASASSPGPFAVRGREWRGERGGARPEGAGNTALHIPWPEPVWRPRSAAGGAGEGGRAVRLGEDGGS